MMEIYKIKNSYAPLIMQHLFQFYENHFNMTKLLEFLTRQKKTSNFTIMHKIFEKIW